MKEKILQILLNSKEYISGEELSKRLGVSRTAIWKNINKLKDENYKIDSVTKKGYKLINSPDKLYKDELNILLKQSKYFEKVYTYNTIDSTNNEAKRRALNDGARSGIFVSEEQTQGKGRRGKNWDSKLGSGIWMTLLLRPNINPNSASMLTLVTGVAVTKAIKKYTKLDAKIKWPNDIIINSKKVCGILTEMSAEMEYINYVVIGVGLNVNNEIFPEEISDIATSLKIEGAKSYSRKEILVQIIQEFECLYKEFLNIQNLEFIKNEYSNICINIGNDIRVEKSGEIIIGTGQGINEKGELILKTKDNEILTISAGEVSVRGMYGYV